MVVQFQVQVQKRVYEGRHCMGKFKGPYNLYWLLHGRGISLVGHFTSLDRSHIQRWHRGIDRAWAYTNPPPLQFSWCVSSLYQRMCVPINGIYSKMKTIPFYPFPFLAWTSHISCMGLMFSPQVRPNSKPFILRLRDKQGLVSFGIERLNRVSINDLK